MKRVFIFFECHHGNITLGLGFQKQVGTFGGGLEN